jgi:hypothetical protein
MSLQIQVNKQVQEMIVEYKDLCDMFLSVLATAENMVNDSKKKYGYYDEFDSSKNKNPNGLALQFLRLLSNFKENRRDFIAEYRNTKEAAEYSFINNKGQFQFPKKIDLKIVQEKINKWKELAGNELYKKYFDEIMNILNYNSTLDLEAEKQKFYNFVQRTEEQKKENIKNIMKVKAYKRKEDEETEEQYARTGQYEYDPVYHAKAGRWWG